MIAYRAVLDVPTELVRYLAGLLRAERRRRGTRKNTRVASCWKQTVFVLTWFRTKDDIELLGAGFGLSRATAYRYHAEGVKVLAAQAPDLSQALERVKDEGWACVILDGTVVAGDRDAAPTVSKKGKVIDRWCSGKAHHHGGNLQALMRPDGLPIWISGVEPGGVHDLTAARGNCLGALYAAAAAGLPTLADGGYAGAGIGVHVPVKQPGGTGSPRGSGFRCSVRLRRFGVKGWGWGFGSVACWWVTACERRECGGGRFGVGRDAGHRARGGPAYVHRAVAT